MLLRTAFLCFCCGCWFALLSGVLPTYPQSLFQVIAGTKITNELFRNVKNGEKLFECFIRCISDPLCSGLTLKNYSDDCGRFCHMVECDHLYLEGDSELTNICGFTSNNCCQTFVFPRFIPDKKI